MKATAALSRDPQAPFTVEEIDISAPQSHEVLVRLVATGVCHTDLVTKSMLPAEYGAVVLGHEGAGVVAKVGADVANVKVGDHVLMSFSSCGACSSCIEGYPGYCCSFTALNMPGVRGDGSPTLSSNGTPVLGMFFGQSSFASYALTTARNLVVVDDDVDLVIAAPLGCGFQTGAGAVLNILRPRLASTLVVFGAGGVGLAALMAAAASDVQTIVAVDPVATRRELASKLGATAVIDPASEDVVSAIKSITGGGASHALDTTGVPVVINQALEALGPMGTLVVVGLGQAEVTVNILDILSSGKTLRGCIEGDAIPQEFLPRLISMHRSGRFPFEKLVTPYPVAEINRAVADSASGKTIKPVLVY